MGVIIHSTQLQSTNKWTDSDGLMHWSYCRLVASADSATGSAGSRRNDIDDRITRWQPIRIERNWQWWWYGYHHWRGRFQGHPPPARRTRNHVLIGNASVNYLLQSILEEMSVYVTGLMHAGVEGTAQENDQPLRRCRNRLQNVQAADVRKRFVATQFSLQSPRPPRPPEEWWPPPNQRSSAQGIPLIFQKAFKIGIFRDSDSIPDALRCAVELTMKCELIVERRRRINGSSVWNRTWWRWRGAWPTSRRKCGRSISWSRQIPHFYHSFRYST